MRRFVVVASMIASGVACVNLDKPPEVAECATQGTCVNGTADALSGPQPDGSSRPSDGAGAQDDGRADSLDGTWTDARGAAPDGGSEDLPLAGPDGPEGLRDLAAPDVPAGVCSAGGAPKPAGTPCRLAVDLCDVTEVCDGVSIDCPADKLAAPATPCRPLAGDCDIAETCDGTSTACPVDGFKAAGTVCRAVAGVCDVAESCDGAGPSCPADSVSPSTTPCRASTDKEQCDPTEKCTGAGVECPADVKYTKPSVPAAVTATGGTLQVTLSWAASTGATGYNVKQSLTSGSGYTTLISSPTTTQPPFIDTGLAGGATYYYVVSAIKTIPSCESANSSEATAKTTGICVAPAAPVIAATPANGSVTVNWPAITGAVSYTVARSATSGTGYATIGTVKTGTTFIDGNVVNGVTYYYVVTASNGTCSSVNSNQASTAPACTPPVAPTGVSVTAGNGSATLKWSASAAAVSYSIYRNTTGSDPFTFVNSTSQLTFTDSNVVNDTKYYYVVRASNGSCASGNSTVASVTPACTPPLAPTGVTVTSGDKQNALSWTAPTGATQYRVSRNGTATGAFTQIAAPTTTNYTDKPLTNGTAYYYVVAASNGSCWSADSAVASGTPECVPPSVPGTLTATPGDGQVSLTWAASTGGATTYTIWRKTGATGTYASVGTATSTTYIDTLLVNGTTYYYRITSGNGSCDSSYNTEQSATPVAACAQTQPANVTATPSGSVQIVLTWNASTPAPASYGIARSTTSGTGYVSIGSVAGTTLTYTDADTTLVKDTTYYYQVTASGSCTATSPEVSAATVCSTPTAPGKPTVANVSGALALTWTAVSGATAYTVYRSTNATGPFTTAVSTNQTAATYTDAATGLTNGTTYYYAISASNANGQCTSGLSAANSAMSCAPTAVPVGLARSVGTSGQVRLTWTASTGATQYTILRGTTSGSEAAVATSTTNSFTDIGLTDWVTYYYKVSAQNGAGNACSSAASAEINATPNGCPVLGVGTNSYSGATTGAYCFISCWKLDPGSPTYGGVGASSFGGRSLTVNNVSVCTENGCNWGATTIPRDYSVYGTTGAYIFRVTGGTYAYAANNWWGNNAAQDCQ
jgi:fibronectin type 3 domain-containing protein